MPLNSNINKSKEFFSINIWGIKFDATNPGKKTIIVLVIILLFILLLTILLKAYILPILLSLKSNSLVTSIAKKITNFIK